MSEELNAIEVISQRVDDLIQGARETLNDTIDEDYDWAKAAGDAGRLSDLLRVRAIIADYQ